MLKTHLQPIVAYFNHSTASTDTATPTGSNQAAFNPLQPQVDYWSGVNSDIQPEAQHRSLLAKIKQRLNRIWHDSLIRDMSPRIWQRVDRQGQPYWQVYDPIADQSHTFFAEAEVYQWLESRYYQ